MGVAGGLLPRLRMGRVQSRPRSASSSAAPGEASSPTSLRGAASTMSSPRSSWPNCWEESLEPAGLGLAEPRWPGWWRVAVGADRADRGLADRDSRRGRGAHADRARGLGRSRTGGSAPPPRAGRRCSGSRVGAGLSAPAYRTPVEAALRSAARPRERGARRTPRGRLHPASATARVPTTRKIRSMTAWRMRIPSCGARTRSTAACATGSSARRCCAALVAPPRSLTACRA